MPDFMNAKITGADTLLSKFRKLEEAAKGNVLITVARSAGMHPLNRMKELVAVDTGNLKRSLHQEDGAITADSASVTAGTDVEYAPPVEFGTRYMAAQPFIRPAFEATRTDAQREVTDLFKLLLRDAIS